MPALLDENFPNFVGGETLLWEIFPVFSLLAASNNPSFSCSWLACVFWLHTHQEVNPVLG